MFKPTHQFASNVVEKCLRFATRADCACMITEIIGAAGGAGGESATGDTLLAMITDPFANYVVQRLLDFADEEQKARLLPHLKQHLGVVKRLTHGKHIATACERLLLAQAQKEAWAKP